MAEGDLRPLNFGLATARPETGTGGAA